MTAIDLFNRLQELEILLSLVGNQLRYDAPKGIMTPELLDAISAHKVELIELIRRGALEDLVEFHKEIGLKYVEADWHECCAYPRLARPAGGTRGGLYPRMAGGIGLSV